MCMALSNLLPLPSQPGAVPRVSTGPTQGGQVVSVHRAGELNRNTYTHHSVCINRHIHQGTTDNGTHSFIHSANPDRH